MDNKDAIVVLKNYISPYDDCMADNEVNQAIRLAIKALEERPQGMWERTGEFDEFYGRVYKCTYCGKEVLGCDCRNFCTWCGADIGGKEE